MIEILVGFITTALCFLVPLGIVYLIGVGLARRPGNDANKDSGGIEDSIIPPTKTRFLGPYQRTPSQAYHNSRVLLDELMKEDEEHD